MLCCCCFFFFQAEDGIRDSSVTGVQTCALPISVITTEDTPARPLSFGNAWARSWPDRSPKGSFAETAYSRIGRLLVENGCTVDGSACGGAHRRTLDPRPSAFDPPPLQP